MDTSLANSLLIMLLILIALVAAWYLGYRSKIARSPNSRNQLSKDYFIGLNYLLNDEPDEAIDTFINALEINSNTLETHMALGTLLRRRGKVDRSIVVYQSLLARTGLTETELNSVKLALVKSYIAAGLLDRAERLLEDLKNAGASIRASALALAITLYQLESEWESAISSVNELLAICSSKEKSKYQIKASHFHCEIAEIALNQAECSKAKQHLIKSFHYNKNNIRASLLLGKLELNQGNYKAAIKALGKVKHQDNNYLSETFIPLLECYQKLDSDKNLEKFIKTSLDGEPSVTTLLTISEFIAEKSTKAEALSFLQERIKNKPSLRIMKKILCILSEDEDNLNQKVFSQCRSILEDYITSKALYRCENCGFEAKSIHWICPGCSEWEMIKPITGLPRVY